MGIWHYTKDGVNEAWKVLKTKNDQATTKKLATMEKAYGKASGSKVPMGKITPLLLRTTITYVDTKKTSTGIVLITEWVSGTWFQQSKLGKHLKHAMTVAGVPAGKASDAYKGSDFTCLASVVPTDELYSGFLQAFEQLRICTTLPIPRALSRMNQLNRLCSSISTTTQIPALELTKCWTSLISGNSSVVKLFQKNLCSSFDNFVVLV